MPTSRAAFLAATLAVCGCASSQAPEEPGDAGDAAKPVAAEPAQPASAAPDAAAPALTEREQDEKRLVELYPRVLQLTRTGGNVEELRAGAEELRALLEKLTGRTKDAPTFQVAGEEVIREAARKYNPEFYEQILAAKKAEAAQERRAAVAQAYYQMLQVRGALAKYEGEHGALPATLQQLAKVGLDRAALKDPWGHALVYERRSPGFALGSVGPDGKRGTRDDLDAANAAKALGIDKR